AGNTARGYYAFEEYDSAVKPCHPDSVDYIRRCVAATQNATYTIRLLGRPTHSTGSGIKFRYRQLRLCPWHDNRTAHDRQQRSLHLEGHAPTRGTGADSSQPAAN